MGHDRKAPKRAVDMSLNEDPVRRARGLKANPAFRIEGRDVVPDPLQMQSVPRNALGSVVTSLADDESSARIVNAIDVVISRAWG